MLWSCYSIHKPLKVQYRSVEQHNRRVDMVIIWKDRIRDTTIKSLTPSNSNFGICGPYKCFWVSVDYKDFNNTHTSSPPTRRVTPLSHNHPTLFLLSSYHRRRRYEVTAKNFHLSVTRRCTRTTINWRTIISILGLIVVTVQGIHIWLVQLWW